MANLKLQREDLHWAESRGILQPGQAEALWRALEQRHPDAARFDLVHVSYYAGALLVIGAMGWFMTLAWEDLPGLAQTGIALVYAAIFAGASHGVGSRLRLRVPSGLLLTVAVCMAPLAVYGVLRQFDLWPQGQPGAYRGLHVWVRGSWIALELATILAGLVALRFQRFAFLTAPVAVALWYLSMDVAPLLLGTDDLSFNDRAWVSLWFGLAMLVGAYAVDLRGRHEDMAFWLYLFGLLAFWGGLSLLNSGSELGKLLYCLANLVLIGVALLLRRPMFLLFGSLGCFGYLAHLAYRVFADSLLFTLALTFLGVALITLGVIYQRHRHGIDRFMRARITTGVGRLLPPRVRENEIGPHAAGR